MDGCLSYSVCRLWRKRERERGKRNFLAVGFACARRKESNTRDKEGINEWGRRERKEAKEVGLGVEVNL